MKAERKNVESDLAVDVFFSNLVAGRDGLVPEIGQNGRWWIGGRDTGVPARAVDGVDGTDGKTPYVGANNNWWIDGRDLGVKAKAPVVSVGANGHWLIDGVDTAVPSGIDTFLSKTDRSSQSVAGPVAFGSAASFAGSVKVAGPVDMAKLSRLDSGVSGATKDGFMEFRVPATAPHYVCVEPIERGRIHVILEKPPEAGDIYMVFAASLEGCRISSGNAAVKFRWSAGLDEPYFDTRQRCTVVLHGYQGHWFPHTIGD